MRMSRHPITEVGLGHFLKLFGENMQKGFRCGKLECKRSREGTLYGKTVVGSFGLVTVAPFTAIVGGILFVK